MHDLLRRCRNLLSHPPLWWKDNEANRERLIAEVDAALAEPVQEPVAWQWLDTATFKARLPERAVAGEWRPLYAEKGTP